MSFSLLQPLLEIPLAVLDVETTGASADFGHRVIELGIVRIEAGRVVAEYEQLIDPGRTISAAITALTGISTQMVAGQPRFCDQLAAALKLLQGAIVVGHNIRFDLSFLHREFRRSRCDIQETLGEVPVLDTVRIARRRFGRGGNGLQRLAPRLGIMPAGAHRALVDAQTTGMLLQRLLEPIGGWNAMLCDAIQAQGGPMGLMPLNPRQRLLPLELEEALEQKCPVMMEYLDANDYRTHRAIEPLHIRRVAGELILIAHCQLRNERRTFKLERIVNLTRIDEVPPVSTPALSIEVFPTSLFPTLAAPGEEKIDQDGHEDRIDVPSEVMEKSDSVSPADTASTENTPLREVPLSPSPGAPAFGSEAQARRGEGQGGGDFEKPEGASGSIGQNCATETDIISPNETGQVAVILKKQ